MKDMIMRNWNFMRVLRLILGVAIVIQAALVKDVVLTLAGGLFSIMALMNIGCCGTNGCSVDKSCNNINSRKQVNNKEAEYEEVA